jgi:tRNA1(Val) A37 N6-methylase TrmN6
VITDGHLLGGRAIYRQPADGFRSGIEPVLLAASVPVRPHEHVLEAGTGAGAALLCLGVRVPGIKATGVEADEAMAALAAANAQANGFTGIDIIAERLETAVFPRAYDHAIANPPYHPPDSPASSTQARDSAKRGSGELIEIWIERLGGALRDRGSLTLVVPAGMVPACLAAMGRYRCPCSILFPLWPKTGRPAKLVLVRGVKNGLTPLRLAAGLVLHNPDGSFTPDAEAILRDGSALPLDR